MNDRNERRETELISRAGAILRELSPPRIATLFLVDEGVGTQREIAERLDLTPAAISNYVETLEALPTPLVRRDGSDRWTTTEGDEIISIITRTTNNLGVSDLRSATWGESSTELLDEMDACLDPLHTFRSALPFHALYSVGVRCSSGWAVAITEPESARVTDIVADVKGWTDKRVTRKQVRSRLGTFVETDVVEIDGDTITLTEKGLEHCHLLNGVIRMLEPDERTGIGEDTESIELRIERSTGGDIGGAVSLDESDKTLAPTYYADGPVLSLPTTTTVGRLVETVGTLDREYGADTDLELKWTLTRTDTPSHEG